MTDGRHAAAVALAEHALAEPALERIRWGTRSCCARSSPRWRSAGVPEPELRAELIQGLVDAAARLAQRRPGDVAGIVDATLAQATRGLS